MAAIISDKIKRLFLTQIFDEATGTKIGDSDNYYYMAIGRSQTWDPSGTTDLAISPLNDEREEREFRYNVQSVKAVEAFSFVVNVKPWTANAQYAQYNDNVVGQPATSYYVRTVDNNVYVCIRTGKDAQGNIQLSTIKPDHTDTSLPVETDGYIWKYMYTISTADTNAFVTSNYMPVKFVDSAIATDPYFGQFTIQNAAVPGQIIGYRVINGGENYDSSDTITIVGNGTGAKARLLVSAGTITVVELGDSANVGQPGFESITSVMGSGYDYANVRVTSATGNDSADIVPVFAHKNGLGADAREDLRATALMFNIKPEGSVDVDDNETWATGGQDYRQVALWRNPLDSAGEKFTATAGLAMNRLTITSSIPAEYSFDVNIRMRGDSNAEAWIDYVDSDEIWYHQDEYTGFTAFRVGEPINIGEDPAAPDYSRVVDNHVVEPDVDRYSGDIFFVSNDAAQPRTTASTDDIKLVIQL